MLLEKKPKILITGNLGYVGFMLAEEVKKRGWGFLGIDKEAQNGSNVMSFNLRDKNKTLPAIKEFGPDVLIHAGSHSALIYKDDLYNPFIEDFESLSNILEVLQTLPNCRLIYFSSSYVYSGLSADSLGLEESLLKPGHNFGVAKSFFEQFILRNHKNSVVFRLCSVFGQGNPKHPNTISLFVQEAVETQQINVWGKGERKLQYVYNKDVLNYTFSSLGLQPGLYNLGGDEYVSVAEAGKAIADFFKVKLSFLTDKGEGETLPFLSNNLIKSVAGKNYFTPFSVALTEYLKSLN